MGAKERIMTLRLLEKLTANPQWCRELGIEAGLQHRESRSSEEKNNMCSQKGANLWNL